MQLSSKEAPSFGGNKGDAASTIIGLLEVAESDFTRLLSAPRAGFRKESFDELTEVLLLSHGLVQVYTCLRNL